MKARITQPCFIGGGLRKRGDVVDVRDEDFAESCMERVSSAPPEEPEKAPEPEDTPDDKPKPHRRKVVRKGGNDQDN